MSRLTVIAFLVLWSASISVYSFLTYRLVSSIRQDKSIYIRNGIDAWTKANATAVGFSPLPYCKNTNCTCFEALDNMPNCTDQMTIPNGYCNNGPFCCSTHCDTCYEKCSQCARYSRYGYCIMYVDVECNPYMCNCYCSKPIKRNMCEFACTNGTLITFRITDLVNFTRHVNGTENFASEIPVWYVRLNPKRYVFSQPDYSEGYSIPSTYILFAIGIIVYGIFKICMTLIMCYRIDVLCSKLFRSETYQTGNRRNTQI